MARRQDLETRLIASDKASPVIEKVSDELEALEKQGDTAITIGAEDKASAEIRSVSQLLAGLSDEDKKIVLDAQVKDAEREIARILRSLKDVDRMDDQEIEIRVTALGDARADLERIQDEMRALDGSTAEVTVESHGVSELVDQLDLIPAGLASIAGGLTGPAGVAAGIGAAVVGAQQLADGFAEATTEVQVLAQLTGDSAEDASRLRAVWQTTGADINDLNDVILQMNGVLAQSPELARQLGVSLEDGATGGERFVQVLEAIRDAGGDANEQALLLSQLLGEEGARQGAKLLATVDDIGAALAGVSEGQVFTDDEIAKGEELRKATADMAAKWEAIKLDIGEIVSGPMTDLLGQITGVLGGLTDVANLDILDPKTWADAKKGGKDLLGLNDQALQQQWEQRQNREEINDVIQQGIDLAIQQGRIDEENAARDQEVADARKAAIDEYYAKVLVAGAIIKANNEAWRDVVDNANKIPDAVAEAVRQAQEFNDTVDESKVSAAELMDEFDTAKIEAATTALGDFLAARQPGVTWLDTLGETKEAMGEIFKQIKQNEGKIPDIFKVGTEAGRDFRDAIDEASEQVNDRLIEALRNTEGNFDEVRRQAKALRDQFRERIALKLGVDLEHATREERIRINGLVNAVIPTDKQIRVGIKLAEEDLAKLKADLSIAELEKLLPATALQLRVDLAEGDITPEEAAATAQEALNAEGLNIDLDVDTNKADPKLLAFANEEQLKLDGRPLFIPVSPNLPSDRDMEHVSIAAQDFYDRNGVTLPVTPVLVRPPTGTGTGGIPLPAMVGPTGFAAAPAGAAPASMWPPIQIPVKPVTINQTVNFNAGTVGDPYDAMRAVDKANRRIARILPKVP